MDIIIVKMSHLKSAFSPYILKTNSLGSCVGIVLYDKYKKIGGMAHVMLAKAPQNDLTIGKYADTTIPFLIEEIIKKGANKNHLKAMIFGGAEMFFTQTNANSTIRIGYNNVLISKKILQDENIPIIHEQTGGNSGRTIELDCSNGIVTLIDFQRENQQFSF